MALYSDSPGRYVSPAQVRLFVDNLWIDDASSVQWAVQDDKTPKFGFNDRHFRAVALGRTIVQGQLSIEFRFNGYLRSAITKAHAMKHLGERIDNDYSSMDDELTKAVAAIRISQSTDEKERIAGNFTEKFGIEGMRLLAKRTSVEIWNLGSKSNNQDRNAITPRTESESQEGWLGRIAPYKRHRAGMFSKGFNIAISYGIPPNNTVAELNGSTARSIIDAHIVGESQTISIDVPDGSRAIREVYNFFAKDISPGLSSSGSFQSG